MVHPNNHPMDVMDHDSDGRLEEAIVLLGDALEEVLDDSEDIAAPAEVKAETTASISVGIFNEMLDNVLDLETHLFSAEELQLLQTWKGLQESARLLLAVLLRRKRGKFHRQSTLTPKHLSAEDASQATQVLLDGQFCHGCSDLSLEELLELLFVKDLVEIAKALDIKYSKATLLKHERINQLLGWAKVKTRPSPFHPASVDESRAPALLAAVQEQLNLCVCLNESIFELTRTLVTVYFRCRWPMQTIPYNIIKSQMAQPKVIFPDYAVQRSGHIWASRDDLNQYMKGLVLLAQLDGVLDRTGQLIPRSQQPPKMFGLAVRTASSSAVFTNSPRKTWKVYKLKAVKDIYNEARGVWKEITQAQGHEEPRPFGMDQFHPGHVLTQVMHQCTYQLDQPEDVPLQYQILDQLLNQTRWLRKHRDRWCHTFATLTQTVKKADRAASERARRRVKERLIANQQDNIQSVYQSRLLAVIEELEESLHLHKQDRFSLPDMPEHSPVNSQTVKAVMIDTPDEPQDGSLEDRRSQNQRGEAMASVEVQWQGLDGKPVDSNALVLQHLKNNGYNVIELVGKKLIMSITLLFWDIIFSPSHYGFQTRFQSCPLDLYDPSFFETRRDDILRRVGEIKESTSQALAFLRSADSKHRRKRTIGPGVDWDAFSGDCLRDVVARIPRKSLAALCQRVLTNYSANRFGLPDLCIWKGRDDSCIFVTIQEYGRAVTEYQNFWMDCLVDSGAKACIYGILEKDEERGSASQARPSQPSPSRKRKR